MLLERNFLWLFLFANKVNAYEARCPSLLFAHVSLPQSFLNIVV